MTGHALVVIGIGHDGPAGLSADARAHVAAARVLAGGRRHLAFFPEWAGERIVIDGDLAAVVGRLRERYRRERTVVLASGDPLFYGIGRVLLESFPREDLLFLPHVSSVQLAFARVKETWEDARVVSLHGRPLEALRPAVEARAAKIAVLTDGNNHPGVVADFLRRLGAAEDYALWVCENLGGADERVSRHLPGDMREQSFSPLNVVVLLRCCDPRSQALLGNAGHEAPLRGSAPGRMILPREVGEAELRDPRSQAELGNEKGRSAETVLPLLGIPEGALLHRAGPRGLITRREVRLLALCYLELRPGDVVWDIGAGSGSVAIEAARLSDGPRVFAVERDDEEFRRLEANVARFGAGRVRAVRAEAPEGFADLPDPNAVFVGGSGGRLRDILAAVARRLRPGGRVALNCITLENLALGWDALREAGLEPEATSVQLSRSRPLGRLHCLEPDGPIFILRARKP
jgi:precorrin-6Y C5,15-methyltransferase (decarboxylating)